MKNKPTLKVAPAHVIVKWTKSIIVYNCFIVSVSEVQWNERFFMTMSVYFNQAAMPIYFLFILRHLHVPADKLKLHVSQTKKLQIFTTRRKFHYFFSAVYLKNIKSLSLISFYDITFQK